jgi:hypothetical protein
MAVSIFKFKPADTVWINVEIVVTYSCNEIPKVERVKIRGLKQFGLILSSEYDIEVFVHAARRRRCDIGGDCRDAVEYEFDTKVFVSDVIGLGIGIGKIGTGTAGWTSPSTEEQRTFKTECICCDAEQASPMAGLSVITIVPSTPTATSWFIGFAALSTALTLAALNFDQPSVIPKLVLYGTAVGAVASLSVAVARVVAFLRRGRRQSERFVS